MAEPTDTPTPPDRQSTRRRPGLRGLLIGALVGASLLAVFLTGLFNYVVARMLLTDTVEAQLRNHQAAQVRALSNGLTGLTDIVATVARDRGTVRALGEFAAAYRDLEQRTDLLTPDELAALEQFHEQLDVARVPGADALPAGRTLPRNDAGRYLQYHYVADNPFPADRRSELTAADGDTSSYRAVHAESHPRLAELRSTLGVGDLLLIDDRGRVVYTTDKRIDFATNAATASTTGRGLADAVGRRLPSAAVNDAVLVDFAPYLPAAGRPAMFAAATVSDGADVIGAVALEIQVEQINAITTSGGAWERTGLGDTGETYVVGSDRLLRSDPRRWLEDPEAYLQAVESAGYPPELGAAIAAAGTAASRQPASTDAVDEAFDLQRFVGRTTNFLGQETLTVAGPLPFRDLEWVVVADFGSAEADAVLESLNRGLLVLVPLLVVAVAAVGVLLANRIRRPVEPVVATAAAVAGGNLDPRVPDLGGHEVGDVGRRLNVLTDDLRAQREAKATEEREISDLLLSVLPARLVDQLREGELEVADLADTATVIALTVHGPFDRAGLSPDTALEFSARLSRELEGAAERLGVERVRSASDHHLFAVGLNEPGVAAGRAARFVTEVDAVLERFERDTGVDVAYHAGMSAGDVVAGLLHRETFTYGVFGEPTRAALALDAVATDGQVLIDASVAAELGPAWTVEPASGLVDLRGARIEAQVLVGATAPDRPAAGPTPQRAP